MFDKFPALRKVEKQNFAFQPMRYETWIGGQMVGNGKTKSIITGTVVQENGVEKMNVQFNDQNLAMELTSQIIFDEFITSSDRLQLITVPVKTNVECMGIVALLHAIGGTRLEKNFSRSEPYCCNLFLQKGVIVKITFSFSNPEKLIEFYYNEESLEGEKSELQRIAEEILGLRK